MYGHLVLKWHDTYFFFPMVSEKGGGILYLSFPIIVPVW